MLKCCLTKQAYIIIFGMRLKHYYKVDLSKYFGPNVSINIPEVLLSAFLCHHLHKLCLILSTGTQLKG